MITSFGPVIYIVGSVKIISLLLLHIKDDQKIDNACAETNQTRMAMSWSARKIGLEDPWLKIMIYLTSNNLYRSGLCRVLVMLHPNSFSNSGFCNRYSATSEMK